MPTGPLKSNLHVDKLLSQISVKYRPSGMIGMDVFPTLNVKKDSDLYRVYTRNFRIPETRRAPGSLSREHGFNISSASYVLREDSLKKYVSDDEAENYDMSDLRADSTEELTDKIMLRVEKDVADLFTTTNWSLNVSLAAAWTSNTSTTNPIPTVDTASTTIVNNSGFVANFGILERAGFIAAKNHSSVLDRTKYVSKEMTKDMLAALFDLDELLVAHSTYDSSADGATESITQIWDNNMFVGYKPARPTPLAPSCGYLFKKNKPMVRRWRDNEREAEAIEVRMKWQPKIVASLAGYLIRDVS